ncbi:MAG: hypoxanthine phosphoribosyltransferase [Firmicutes bacterium]|nr:hypoxanthine phosphoribosyltransferase [Bacillota bacterium]
MLDDLESVLYTSEQLQSRIGEVGAQISRDYAQTHPLVIGVLKGAFVFLSDLVRHIDIPIEIDFIATSSYGSSTQSSGAVRMLKDLDQPAEGRDILLVEDIVDTGTTLNYLRDTLIRRGARSVKIASAFDKPSRRRIPIVPDYCCFTVPNAFLVGYGLDYAERYRHLSCVGILRPEIYTDEH